MKHLCTSCRKQKTITNHEHSEPLAAALSASPPSQHGPACPQSLLHNPQEVGLPSAYSVNHSRSVETTEKDGLHLELGMLIKYINLGYDDFLLVCKVEGQEVFRSENWVCNIKQREKNIFLLNIQLVHCTT